MLRAERELGDVVDGAILVHHQDVVLAVASSTWHIAKLYFSVLWMFLHLFRLIQSEWTCLPLLHSTIVKFRF